MAKSPMVEASVLVLETAKQELTFHDLFERVVKELDMDQETATKRIAKLYSDLTLDRRFISLPENKWDLKKHRKLDEIIKDTSDNIIDDEEDEDLLDYDEDEEEIEDKEEDDEDIILDVFDVVEEDEDYDEDIEEFKELAIASED